MIEKAKNCSPEMFWSHQTLFGTKTDYIYKIVKSKGKRCLVDIYIQSLDYGSPKFNEDIAKKMKEKGVSYPYKFKKCLYEEGEFVRILKGLSKKKYNTSYEKNCQPVSMQ